MENDDDEGSEYGGLYRSGHWEWNAEKDMLAFISDDESDTTDDSSQLVKFASAGTIQFRDDIDVMEQDVKDIALFTAPLNILSDVLINMLHRPTTERFIRALILYCQYFLQVVEIMSTRQNAMETTIRTPQSDLVEEDYRDNLCDLRLLVAKEYSTMNLGAADMKKYHHIAPGLGNSMTDRDARLFETLLRMCIQIVWLALGRKSFSQIELEVNRLFKTEIYNSVEHNRRTGYYNNMSPQERAVLLGHCIRYDHKLITRSPMTNEIFCHRKTDYRLLGLGVVNNKQLTSRLLYLQRALTAPEELFKEYNIVLGILGMLRSRFEPMLFPLAIHQNDGASRSKTLRSGSVKSRSGRMKSAISMKSGEASAEPIKLYEDIVLPKKDAHDVSLPEEFPDSAMEDRALRRFSSQRERWLNRLARMLNSRKSTAC